MISFVVPCLNEEQAIPIFYSELRKIIDEAKIKYEVLFVDDGSTDRTLNIIKEIANNDVSVKFICFSRNFGKESAIYAGLSNAMGDYICVMDVDLQDPPSLIPRMIEMIEEEGVDCVATRRINRVGEPVIRSFMSKGFYKIINLISDTDVVDGARDYRIMKRNMVKAIISMREYNRFSKGIFSWVGFKTKYIEYSNIERSTGETKWNFWKLFRYAIDGIVSFSQVPLNFVSWIGLCTTSLSFISLCFVIIRKILLGDPVSGWASTICVIVFMGGVQLMSLGIMCQYIAKTYMESKKRPHYIISESNINNIETVN